MTGAAVALPPPPIVGEARTRAARTAVAASDAGAWRIVRTDTAAHRIDIPVEHGIDWTRDFLLISDLHLDNPHCLRDRLRKTLAQAVERNAIILIIGDALDLMQGKYDPRSNKADLRPEYIGKPYLSAVLDDWSDFMKPCAANTAIVTRGNHEQAVARRVEFDIAENLSARLRADHSAPTLTGAYAGYVRLVFTTPSAAVRTLTIAYDHGSGGGGPVTRGVIGTNRRATYTPDADWILTGHVHERWHVETTQEKLDRAGKVTLRSQHHLCLGGWKEERLIGSEFHVERGRGPKPIGGYWARVGMSDGKSRALVSDFTMTN